MIIKGRKQPRNRPALLYININNKTMKTVLHYKLITNGEIEIYETSSDIQDRAMCLETKRQEYKAYVVLDNGTEELLDYKLSFEY